MIQLCAIQGPTGRLLREMLTEKGLLGKPVKAVVNYGYNDHDAGLPTLNANAGKQNKYEELVKLHKAGVRTVPFSRSAADLNSPILGRKFHHTRGTDIFIYRVRPLLRGDHLSDYYTQLVPKEKEYRVWAFRGKALATYEKTLEYPNKNGCRGRNKEVWNWANGYSYRFCNPQVMSNALKQIGANAVKALDLDFGAADIILGRDGLLYVLEVNTAPGVEGRRQGIISLANCIERWAKGGFKTNEKKAVTDYDEEEYFAIGHMA